MIEKLPAWLPTHKVTSVLRTNISPIYIYSKKTLSEQAKKVLKLPAPYGFTARYAMKANPHSEILKIFKNAGLHIDASSGYEAETALEAGFKPSQVLITAQQTPDNLKELVELGVQFNATSLHQLETYCRLFPGKDVSVRINPAMGDGMNNRLTTGGVNASFGIWHEYIPKVHEIVNEAGSEITRLHTHIGSGTNPEKWAEAEKISLKLLEQFDDATILNLGGGFKVARMSDEPSANMEDIGQRLKTGLEDFYKRTNRKIHLEVEPGTFLTANTAALITKVIDKTNTGKDGHVFLRTNTGMNDFLRPGMYGAQHPLITVKKDGTLPSESEDYVVVGHNCESTDILTPYPHDPERLQPRLMGKAEIGDYVVITGTGAYGSSFSTKCYNGYPSATVVFI